MAGISIKISKTYITTHLEISRLAVFGLHSCWFSADWVVPALFLLLMAPWDELFWDQCPNFIGCQVSMVSGTGHRQRRGAQ